MMLRRLLLYGFLFLAPFLIYALYLAFVKRQQALKGEAWSDAPLTWLAIFGLVLFAGGLVSTSLLSGERAGGVYRPPTVVDGRIKPAEILPPEETGNVQP